MKREAVDMNKLVSLSAEGGGGRGETLSSGECSKCDCTVAALWSVGQLRETEDAAGVNQTARQAIGNCSHRSQDISTACQCDGLVEKRQDHFRCEF